MIWTVFVLKQFWRHPVIGFEFLSETLWTFQNNWLPTLIRDLCGHQQTHAMFACWWSSTSLPKAWHKDPSGWWRRPVLRGWGWFRPTSTLQIVHCSFYPRNIWFWDGVHIGIVPRLRWFHLAPKQFTKTKAPKQFQRQLSRSMYQSSWGC